MPELSLDCPHCRSQKIGFTFGGLHQDVKTAETRHGVLQTWNTLFVCRHCHKGVVVQFESRSPKGRVSGSLVNCHSDPTKQGFTVRRIYPKVAKAEAPQHIPGDIEQDFLEALDGLRRGNFNSAGMMFRRVLDRATLKVADEPEAIRKKDLFKRIEVLESEKKLTPAMKDLAHVIRNEGNYAAHEDEEFDEPRAEQMKEFTELFLIYAFTLPVRIKKAQGEAPAD